MGDLSKHFDSSEFKCPDCSVCIVSKPFIEKLQRVRDLLGFPMKVSEGGGCRCRKYNREVKGAPQSKHLAEGLIECCAVDIATDDPYMKNRLVYLAGLVGLKGVGVYPRHIHLDDRDSFAMWVRDKY